jgi:hypothetical protein
MDKMSWDITSIVVDGVEIPYTASENSLVKGNDGSCYRKLIYDNWTGKNVKDIDPNVNNTQSIVINFTISGIKTTEETTVTTTEETTVTTTTEETTTTTTEPVTTTTVPETTTTVPDVTTDADTNLEKIENVSIEISTETDKDTGEEVSVAVAVITPNDEEDQLPEDVQIMFDGKQLDTNFFSYNNETGEITFNTVALAKAFDVDLEEILNNVEIYGVTAPTVENIPDVNGDGEVGVDDLLVFQSEFKRLLKGKVSYDDIASCDVNGDGQINVLDLLEIKRQILGYTKK